jgi:hypothetical protein
VSSRKYYLIGNEISSYCWIKREIILGNRKLKGNKRKGPFSGAFIFQRSFILKPELTI